MRQTDLFTNKRKKILNYESSPIFLKPFEISDERTNGEGIIRRGNETGQARAVIVPKPTECPTEPIERCLRLLASLTGSVTFQAEERFHQFLMHRIEQGKPKRINQHNQAKQ